jgi:hypothetical protein
MGNALDFRTSETLERWMTPWLVLGAAVAATPALAGPAFAPGPGVTAEPRDVETTEPPEPDVEQGRAGEHPKILIATPPLINWPGHWLRVKGSFELGFLSVLYHKIKFSRSGSYFDYVEEGNQDNLFFFWRVSAEMEIVDHHSLIFLYQPLDVVTQTLMSRDVVVDDLTFPAGTPTNDFFSDSGTELAIGLSLQIRNATIVFTSEDGSLRRARNNIGPVPVIKIRGRYTFDPGVWIGTEVDGFIASGKFITGSRKDFLGAILDASLRVGFDLTRFLETFVNLRYIGGGARGTSKEKGEPGDGYTKNWISLLTFSIGIGFK